MTNWNVYIFECADISGREALMGWFEENHPVEFPLAEESTFSKVETDSGPVGADYAWIDRYLYVTVMGAAENIVSQTRHLWSRAAMAAFDGETETATEVTLIVDTDGGANDEVEAVHFSGLEGYAGNDAMYALAMKHEFRFRSYAVQSPTTQFTPHAGAFDFVSKIESFVEHLQKATRIDPTEAGLEFLQNDPAATPPDETSEDVDRSLDEETRDDIATPLDDDVSEDVGASPVPNPQEDTQTGLDRVTVVDTDTGKTAVYDSPDEVPVDRANSRFMNRIRRLLGD